ncbi:MAG: polysaccharide deacetylase family protein, partial [Aeromicrobium sp.]
MRRPRARRGTILGAVLALIVAALPALVISSPARAASPTVISFTFDDGYADQLPAAASLAAQGMKGTFYVNTGTIGREGIMTRAQLDSLKAAGHEVGGHTVNHTSLPSLPAAEAKRQICLDRNNLHDWGFAPRSFAYPFAEMNASVAALVRDCGYNSARNLGDLKSRFGGIDGLYAETTPPPNAYETRALDQVESTWTLQDLKDSVTNAEDNGGGWVQLTFHNVCTTTCPALAVKQSVFDEFVVWLKARQANTVVKTVGDVIGGPVKAKVAVADPPPPSDASGLTNPSFETVNPDGAPVCWMKGGFGSNTALFDTVTPGHTGERAGRLTVTNYADGDAKLLPALDLGTCAPGAGPGKAYNLSAWYKSTANTQFDVYIRDASGTWIYWDSSPYFGPQSGWTNATWTTGVVPDGYTGISFGLNLFSNGELVVDDYGITSGTATSPVTTATVTPAAANGTGGWYTTRPTVAFTKTGGAAGWTIQYSFDGINWLAYAAGTQVSIPDGTTTVSYRAKGAGTYAEPTKTLTLKVDTAAPTVSAAFDKASRTLTATAADATPGSGVAKIETSTNGTTWSTYSAPIVVPDSASAVTYSVRSTDAAGNVSTTATQVVPPALKTSAAIAPAAPDGANGWYDTTPTITVTKVGATPNAEYSWDGATWTPYTVPVTVPDGARTFRYRGVSGSEKGDVNQLEVKVDTAKPTVSVSFD